MEKQNNSGVEEVVSRECWVPRRICYFAIVSLLLCHAISAEGKEKYATTDDGFRIRVHANGSWSVPSTKFIEITGTFERISGRDGFGKYLLIEKAQRPNTYAIKRKGGLFEDWIEFCTGALHAGRLQGSSGGADVDITHEDSRMLLKIGKAHMSETAYYRRINIEELTRQAEVDAVKEAKRWGAHEGEMNWTDAANLCKGKGMRLPTIVEFDGAFVLRIPKMWESELPSKTEGSWWSSEAGMEGHVIVFGEGHGSDFPNSLTAHVRCFREK